jgi:hypothetical protein
VLLKVGALGLLPKDIAAKLVYSYLEFNHVTRWIVCMNKRLAKEFD